MPQYIRTDRDGNKFYYKDKTKTILHREDGPAIENVKNDDGYREWWVNGRHHRVDGPAIELPNGYKAWYLNGELHREDGPAAEYANGTKEWWINDKFHREDGPAVEWADGTKEWWINNVFIFAVNKDGELIKRMK